MSMRTSRFVAILCLAALPLAQAACDSDDGPSETGDATGGQDAVGGDTTGPDGTGGSTCNPVTQDGCEAGQNCTYASQDATGATCVESGALEPGAECGDQVEGTCSEGICLSLNDTGFRCYTFCELDSHCPEDAEAEATSCLALDDAPYRVCELQGIYETCDLLGQDCDGDKGCYLVSDEPEPVCLPAGEGVQGDACDNLANACEAGLVCVGDACRRLCDTNASQPCGDDTTACSSYYESVGFCDE